MANGYNPSGRITIAPHPYLWTPGFHPTVQQLTWCQESWRHGLQNGFIQHLTSWCGRPHFSYQNDPKWSHLGASSIFRTKPHLYDAKCTQINCRSIVWKRGIHKPNGLSSLSNETWHKLAIRKVYPWASLCTGEAGIRPWFTDWMAREYSANVGPSTLGCWLDGLQNQVITSGAQACRVYP